MSGRLAYEDVYRPLADAVANVRMSSCPVFRVVLCGIEKSAKRDCGGHIGDVVAVPDGIAWNPREIDSPETRPEGRTAGAEPMLLPTSSPEERGHFCTYLNATCSSGHGWTIGIGELLEAARVPTRDPLRMRRIIPKDWGPLVDDPIHWSDDELDEAVYAADLIRAGRWFPAGTLPGVQESQARSRAVVLLEMVNGEGDYADKMAHLQRRLASRAGSTTQD